jgi:hypothetical protein
MVAGPRSPRKTLVCLRAGDARIARSGRLRSIAYPTRDACNPTAAGSIHNKVRRDSLRAFSRPQRKSFLISCHGNPQRVSSVDQVKQVERRVRSRIHSGGGALAAPDIVALRTVVSSGDGHCCSNEKEESMHNQRLMTIAGRQRRHLVRDLLVTAAGAMLMLFYISAFTSAIQPSELVRQAEPQTVEPAPRIAVVTVVDAGRQAA